MQPESRRKSQTALDFLQGCSKSGRFWLQLMSNRDVSKWVEKAMVTEVSGDGDGDLAQILIAIRAAVQSKGKKRPLVRDPLPSAWPPKVRRRLRSKQGPNCIWMTKGIGCVSADLMAAILSSADLSTKLSAMCVSRGLREVLQCSSAWNPLVIDQAECRGLLKSLRASYFSRNSSRSKWHMPQAFNQVSAIDVHLMDGERSVHDQSDTEDDQELRPISMAIVSPMREFSRGWRSFAKVSELTIRNIDSFSIGYDFVHFRCTKLESFGFVKIQYTGHRSYSLEAAQREPPMVDCSIVASMNSARIPAMTPLQSTTISEREALFLLEHPTAYKNGNDISFIHEMSIYNSHLIRKQYKPLVDSLKERFPNSFR